MKKGQKINMHFRAAGVSSTEKVKVIRFDTDTVEISHTISSTQTGGEEQLFLFCRQTGKCKNDSIKPIPSHYIDPQ